MKRMFVIGDIHGSIDALVALIDLLREKAALIPADGFVFLGDYIDRGPASFEVIEYLLELKKKYFCVFLLGNHELFLLDFLYDRTREKFDNWMGQGGRECLQSYYTEIFDTLEEPEGTQELLTINLDNFPRLHLNFLKECQPYFHIRSQEGNYFFSHAQIPNTLRTIDQVLTLTEMDSFESPLFWGRYRYAAIFKKPGYVFFSGHTPQKQVKDYGDVVLMDTGCVYGNVLSAFDIQQRTVFSTAKKK